MRGLRIGSSGLFRAFEQRGADRAELGLGLAISRRGAETCGGELRIRDLTGRGCVFTVVDVSYLSRQSNTLPSPYGAGFVMVFASSVTAPIRANARPSSVAPVFSVID